MNKVNLIEHTTFLRECDSPATPELPVLFLARFEVLSDRAALQIASHNASALFVRIIHEGRAGIESQLIRGDKTANVILVHDAEAILIIARHEGAMLAGALLEVNMNLPESVDMLMRPVASANIVIEQHNLGRLGVSLQYAMETPDLDETVRVSAVKIGGVR